MAMNAPHAAPTVKRHRSAAISKMILGLLCLLFWFVAALLQIQTSEAFLLHGAGVGFVPNLHILTQPLALVSGQLSPDLTKAAMWGWGIEITFLICAFGYETAKEGILHANKKLATPFLTGMVALILFNSWTDFNFGNIASGFWGQVAFAGIMAFIAFFFGTVGAKFVEEGIVTWNK